MGNLYGVFGVVGNTHEDQHVGKAHNPEADLSVCFCHVFDGLERIFAGIDNVIEKTHGQMDDSPKLLTIDRFTPDEFCQIDRPEAARFVRQQGHFCTGVCCLNKTCMRRRVSSVYGINENEAGLS